MPFSSSSAERASLRKSQGLEARAVGTPRCEHACLESQKGRKSTYDQDNIETSKSDRHKNTTQNVQRISNKTEEACHFRTVGDQG